MRSYSEEDTRNALPFSRLIPALEEAFQQDYYVPRRHIHDIGTREHPVRTLIMPAWSDTGFLGIKTVNIAQRNSEKALPGLFATYTLYDRSTGQPVAHMDGNEITARRTAAASALAATFLARKTSSRLLVLGTGRVGSLIPAAYRQVLPISEVMVWNIRSAGAQKMVDRLNSQGFRAQICSELAKAAEWADVISCATLSTRPLIRGAWLTPGTHLDLIGSFTPEMRESDTASIIGSQLFIDTEEALDKSGDLTQPMTCGEFGRHQVVGTLSDLCRRQCHGRQQATERTVFKAVGTALEDLVAASLVHLQ